MSGKKEAESQTLFWFMYCAEFHPHTLLPTIRDNNFNVDLRCSALAWSIGSFKHCHGQRQSNFHARDVSGSLMLGKDCELPVEALEHGNLEVNITTSN